MACNKKNQGFWGKAILSLFLGIVLISCAGTDSSAQKKGNSLVTEQKLPEYATEYWYNGKPKTILTGILYKDNQGIISVDSGHSEVYFENGKIKEKNDWRAKQPVASKQWNENGALVLEFVFPKYIKEYWSNGNTKQIATGSLYRNNQGKIQVDSGHSEIYFESGKIKEQNDWKNKQPIASKRWNENGILIIELDYQKKCTEYWDNGKIKQKGTGILFREDGSNNCSVDSGRSEFYFESGKIKEQKDWKDKQPVAQKEWNEDGTLIKETVFPNYFKEYWSNGKLKLILTGLLYKDNQGILWMDSGWSEVYSESGNLLEQKKWKDKYVVVCKKWNEDGVLTKDINFPESLKEYWDNGKIKGTGAGLIYRDNQGNFSMDSGHSETYFENGKIHQQNDWKNRQLVVQKEWNEKGVLIRESDFPKYVKEYYDNGKIKKEITGLYWTSPTKVDVENGSIKEYYENGRMKQHSIYKEKELYSYKEWRENGTLTYEWDITTSYFKQYNEKGTLLLEIKGYTGKKGDTIENGYSKMYFNNGNLQFQEEYKDKKKIGQKIWHENGKLEYEFLFPKYEKIYSSNGNLHIEKKGTLYYDDQNKIQVQDGSWKAYYDNGQPSVHENYKEKKMIDQKIWYENGILKKEGDVSKGFHKEYYPSGKIAKDVSGKFHYKDNTVILENGTKRSWSEDGTLKIDLVFPKYEKLYFDNGSLFVEEEGTLYYDDQNKIQVQDGFVKIYCENKKPKLQKNYKDRKLVGKTVWNASEIVTISAELPNRYREFYDDGKIKIDVTGTIIEENEGFKIKDGVYNEYDPNGKITNSATYKDFQIISE